MREDEGEEGRERACKKFFNDPLPPTPWFNEVSKRKMSTCQLAGNVLVFLARGNSAIREYQHSDPNACLRSLVFARFCSIAGLPWHLFFKC